MVVILTGILVPAVNDDFEASDHSHALADCNEISTALVQFMSDTGFKPCGFEGLGSYSWLRGPGAQPTLGYELKGQVGNLSWFVKQDYMGGRKRWAGPYLRDIPVDPWGRHYVVFTRGYWKDTPGTGARVWVLSAGPDGILKTSPQSDQLGGDDVGVMLD